MNKLVLLVLNKLTPVVPSNSKVHKGRVKIVAPIDITIGTTIISPDGLGEVVSIFKSYIDDKPHLIRLNLYRGYQKTYPITDLKQYVVYHKLSEQFVKLSPQHYRYIYIDEQPIEYRVSNRLYAMLTEKTRDQYSWIKTLNKHRHGYALLNIIRRNKLIIKKEE